MAETTNISWCDSTFNPWIGCQHATYTDADGKGHAHQGCLRCYAEADMDKRKGRAKWGAHGTRSRTSDAYWKGPLKWNREAKQAGVRRRVFCASLADVFEDWQGPVVDAKGHQLYWPCDSWNEQRRYIPEPDCGGDEPPVTMADMRNDLFVLIDKTPWLDWLLLTKRPSNVWRMWPKVGPGRVGYLDPNAIINVNNREYWFRQNVWLGTSVSNQPSADALAPELLKCRGLCPVLWLSMEPLLGVVDIRDWLVSRRGYFATVPELECGGKVYPKKSGLDWIVVGGESGHGRRAMGQYMAESVRGQCHAACVAFFMKQMDVSGRVTGDVNDFPEKLRVRQFPQPAI